MKWILIAMGGGLGSVLRYAVHTGVQRWAGISFPLGTLVVNVAGCAVLGLLAGMFAATTIREDYRLGLTVGVLGGFTTFSTFGLETFHLSNNSQHALAIANVMLSCALGLLAVWAGFRIAERWLGAA